MKTSIKTFVIALVLLSKLNAQVKVSVSEAVNIASSQRMLSQRMAKDKVYLTAHKNIKEAEKELKYTIYAFENDLKILKDFAPTEAIKQKIKAEEHAFEFYKKQILDDSKKSLNAVIHTNTLFLDICDDLVTEILNYKKSQATKQTSTNNNSIKPTTEVSQSAGKLRYLTQRLNLYYVLNEFDYQNISSLEFENIVKTIDQNIDYLTVLDKKNIQIDEEINKIRFDWLKLKKAIYTDDHIDLEHKKINPKKLNKICNGINYKTNVTEKMYSELNQS